MTTVDEGRHLRLRFRRFRASFNGELPEWRVARCVKELPGLYSTEIVGRSEPQNGLPFNSKTRDGRPAYGTYVHTFRPRNRGNATATIIINATGRAARCGSRTKGSSMFLFYPAGLSFMSDALSLDAANTS